jgi:hypothetical protein
MSRERDGPLIAAVRSPFEFDVGGHVVVWDAVIWSSGERAGVVLLRGTPLAAPDPV